MRETKFGAFVGVERTPATTKADSGAAEAIAKLKRLSAQNPDSFSDLDHPRNPQFLEVQREAEKLLDALKTLDSGLSGSPKTEHQEYAKTIARIHEAIADILDRSVAGKEDETKSSIAAVLEVDFNKIHDASKSLLQIELPDDRIYLLYGPADDQKLVAALEFWSGNASGLSFD